MRHLIAIHKRNRASWKCASCIGGLLITACLVNTPVSAQQDDARAADKTAAAKSKASDDKLAAQLAEAEKQRNAAMQIRKPLLGNAAAVEALAEEYKKNRQAFQSILWKGAKSSAEKKLFDKFLRYRVLLLSNVSTEDEWRNAATIRRRLVKDLKACSTRMAAGAAAKKKFRTEVLAKVAKHCEELLDNQLVVRFNAVTLMGQLDLEPGTASKKPKPYLDVHPTLLKVATDPKQLPIIKVPAVRGLQRMLKLSTVAGATQDKIATELLKEAAKGHPSVPWLDKAICETVASVTTVRNETLDALLRIIGDSSRKWEVRSAAAYAVGRTGMNPNRADQVAYTVVKMVSELAASYNKNPSDPMWKKHLWNAYLAFHHDSGENKADKIGLIKRNPTRRVLAAYELVWRMLDFVITTGKQIPGQALNNMNTWLEANREVDQISQ